MRATEHRMVLLKALVDARHLRTRDCYALLGAEGEPAARAVRAILTRFTREGFLGRSPLVTEESFDGRALHWEYLYWLAPKGLRKVREMGLDPAEKAATRTSASPLMLAHEAAVTECHLALNAAAGEKVWWRQHGLKHAFTVRGEHASVNPDALFFFAGYFHFLEVERSRPGQYRNGESALARKLAAYSRYADPGSEPWRARWPEMEGFYVLFVVQTEARREHLLAAVETAAAPGIFRAATRDDCRREIQGSIWRSPKDWRAGALHRLGE